MNEYMICWAQVYAGALSRASPIEAFSIADKAMVELRKREQKGMFASPAPKSYREAPDAYPYPDGKEGA